MKLIEPNVELWDYENPIDHVARCARVCYKSDKSDNNEALLERLKASSHNSMFRHETHYYIVPIVKNPNLNLELLYKFIKDFNKSPYFNNFYTSMNIYISTNGNFVLDNKDIFDDYFEKFKVNKNVFFTFDCNKPIRRFTFYITTQISTSRELNRTSPNNISEESTRYCNYSKDKFGKEIKICKPHWYNDANSIIQNIFNDACIHAESAYFKLLDEGFLPQDARGVLPIDAATSVAYTYTVDEWKHIIDLRYRGITGKPHPNAKIVIEKVYNQLIDMGYDV